MNSIADAFLRSCERAPLKRCVVFGDRVYTYSDIERGASQFASKLRALGFRTGDRVALFHENNVDFVFAYLGIGLAGGAVVLVNTAYEQVELRHILTDSGARYCVTSEALMPKLLRVRDDLPMLEAAIVREADTWRATTLGGPRSAEVSFALPADLAIIAYTSGTTGRSKGAMLLNRNLLSNIESVTEAWRWSSGDHLLLMLPLFHAHGLMVGLHGTLLMGSSCELHRSFDATTAYDRLSSGEFSMFFGVPTMHARLIAEADKRAGAHAENLRAFKSLRLVVSGSAALSVKTHEDFERLFGQRILERYGMTETIMNMTNPYDGERRAGTVGMPFPRQEARIVDVRTRQLLSHDEIGEIEVRGGHVFAGYLNRPEATAESFDSDRWFKTGDLGKVSADGYFTITGRAKELIITGGYNVYPREVEEVLAHCEGVVEVAVFGLPDADFGEQVCAAVVRDRAELDADALVQFCRDQLASYKKPRRIFFVSALPRNAMGKVDKRALVATVNDSGQ